MRLSPVLTRRAAPVAAMLGAMLGALVLVPPAPASALARDVECAELQIDTPVETASSPSETFTRLGMQETWGQLARGGFPRPGTGVRVAVLDSGIRPGSAGLQVEAGALFAEQALSIDYRGTAMAGLIAAPPRTDVPTDLPVGIAPGATVVDVKVYDTLSPSDENESRPSAAALAAGLGWVADQGRAGVDVAVVGVGVPDDEALRAATRRVVDAGIILVAATGDRPSEEGALFTGEFGEGVPDPGEDAAGTVFPAGYPGVLGVNATAGGIEGADVAEAVLLSSATDVAAPTYGAVTAAVNGGTCVLRGEISTSYAAAEVAGVLALLRSRFPDDTPRQLVARLLATADGVIGGGSSLTGAGVVQPYEAVTRKLRPRADGELAVLEEQPNSDPRARAPEPPADPMVDSREDAVWWGLVGGTAILIAVLLRPLLARRRAA